MKLGIWLLLLITLQLSAQQNPRYSQYMFNPLAYNPAYAGSHDNTSIALIHRSQWVGVNGSPTTQNFSVHTPIKSKKMGLGLQFVNDNLGPKNTTAILGNYAYRIKAGKGKLGFGLRFGIYSYRYQWSDIVLKDPNDALAQAGVSSITVPSIDFGLYYNTNIFFVGAEFTSLNRAKINFLDSSYSDGSRQYSDVNFSLGKAFVINDNLTFRPSLLLKAPESTPGQLDLNLSFLIQKSLWVGTTFRSNEQGIVSIIEYKTSKGLRLGYSFDMLFGKLSKGNGGSHELFLGLDLKPKSVNMVSPRYF